MKHFLNTLVTTLVVMLFVACSDNPVADTPPTPPLPDNPSQCLKLNNTPDGSYVSTGMSFATLADENDVLPLTTQMTICFWVKAESEQCRYPWAKAPEGGSIASFGGSAFNYYSSWFAGNTRTYGSQLLYTYSQSSSFMNGPTSNPNLWMGRGGRRMHESISSWKLIAVSVDGRSSDVTNEYGYAYFPGDQNLYEPLHENNVRVSYTMITTNGTLFIHDTLQGGYNNRGSSSKSFHLGAYMYKGNPNMYFNGSLDDVRVYDRVLDPSEIQDIYNASKNPVTNTSNQFTNGLVAYYSFSDDLSTDIVTDETGNGHNLKLMGDAQIVGTPATR